MKRIALAVVITSFAGLADSALATFPGERGPIAFERFKGPNDETPQIFTVSRPGERARRLTSFHGGAYAPDWSPDGTRIAFERRFGGESPDAIFTMAADGAQPVRLQTGCTDLCLGDNAPAWSPDGRQLVFERAFGPIVDDNAAGLDLMVADADVSGEQLIRHFRSLGREGREPHDAQWSPDGSRIAVNILNTAAKPKNGSAIHVLNADGSQMRRITPWRLNAGNPDWSPEGRRIVFNSSYEGQAAVEVYTVRPDGSGLRRVRRESKRSYSFDPVWSPDGGRIAFVHGTGRKVPHIWSMKRNGKRLRQVTRGRHPDFRPDWGVRTTP